MSLQAIAFVTAILLGSWALLELVLVAVSRRDGATAAADRDSGLRAEDVR